MITRPMLLDETGQKIKLALQRVKNKFLGTTTDPVTPGQAGSSGVSPVIQDDTGREIISALNDLADAVKPASATEQGLVNTGDQEFAGSKTFVIPRVKQGASNVPAAIGYKTFDDIQNGMILMSTYNAHDRYSLYRFQFREYSLSSSTNEPLAFYDYFRLPAPDWDKTENTAYDIITTKNLTDIPDASATARGLVSTGAQTFAGDKTFNGDVVVTDTLSTGQNIYTTGLRITNTTGNGSSLLYRFSDAPSANAEYGRIYMGAANYGGQLHFRQYSGTSAARTSYYEQYDLPKPDEGRTSTGTYNILTTKSSWTLTSGTANSFNVANNSRHMVVVVGSNPVRDGVFLLRASSTGVTQVTDIHKGSSLSYTTTTNNFTITAAGGVATIMFITLNGDLVTKN